jgi:hypothetical protein
VNNKNPASTKANLSILRQICNLIPNHLVPQLAREHGVEKKSRSFTPWSHVVCMVFAQLSHSLGLNDVCDALSHWSGPLSALRGATPPARNTLSHANKGRDAQMAEDLFWRMLEHLQKQSPGFGRGNRGKGTLRRFRRTIHVVDSTTIQLVASCLDWAKHRRRKAAAKCHMRLDMQSFLPRFAIVDTAKDHDSIRAREICAGIQAGEVVVFDKAYIDFDHLFELTVGEVSWVTRAKDNFNCEALEEWSAPKGRILKDELVVLATEQSWALHPEPLRRVTARVEVEGKEVVMTFLTNNLEWSATTIADLYRSRWTIEVFFKQIKQTLQLGDFLGHSANGVRWQVWTALLTYLLMRYLAFLSGWSHSFARLFTVLRSVLWRKIDLMELLRNYGTAGSSPRMRGTPQSAYFPGF